MDIVLLVCSLAVARPDCIPGREVLSYMIHIEETHPVMCAIAAQQYAAKEIKMPPNTYLKLRCGSYTKSPNKVG